LRIAIDVSALAIVIVVLLFLFMPLSTTHPRSAPVDMPAAQHSSLKPGANREDALIVTVGRDGSIFLDDARVAPDDLPDQLREAVRNGTQKAVYIKGDSRAKYGDVKAVLDKIHLAGIEKVTFLTEERSH
jgi:biopolymer transport protein ExbD